VNALVSLIWAGGILLLLGGVVAFWPRRVGAREDAPSGAPDDVPDGVGGA